MKKTIEWASILLIHPIYLAFLILADAWTYIRYPDLLIYEIYLAGRKITAVFKRAPTPPLGDIKDVDLTYGETPFVTLNYIFEPYIKKGSNAIFVDLGCGFGKAVMFMAQRFKIEAVGIDIVTHFIQVATSFTRKQKKNKPTFLNENIRHANFARGTHFFLPWTCFGLEMVAQLTENCETMRPEAIVVTTSFPLKSPCFETLKVQRAFFSWGIGHVYIQKRRPT